MSVSPLFHSHYDLSQSTTLRTHATAQTFVSLTDASQISAIIARRQDHADEYVRDHPVILGGGSNTLFVQDDIPTLVIEIALTDISPLPTIAHADGTYLLTCGAGVIRDDRVRYTIDQGFHGLENLALIPGTVGASPIQNIGAYGVEVEQYIHSVTGYLRATGQQKTWTHEECQFAYRDSIFKRELPNRVIITDVTFTLKKTTDDYSPVSTYAGVRDRLPPHATPLQVADTISEIRRSKLPDPALTPNAGSFFKNPLVDIATWQDLEKKHDGLVGHPVSDTHVKLSAGQLIDRCGFKGNRTQTGVGTSDRHALVIVTDGDAHGADVVGYAQQIIDAVAGKFGVTLEPEVRYV